MCRGPAVLLTAIATGTLAASMLAAAAPARPVAEDISVLVFLSSGVGVTKTTGLNFQLVAEIEGSTGVLRQVTLRIALPTGLRFGTDAPGPSDGCTGDGPVVCTATMAFDGAGTARAGWRWDVVAERAGSYEIAGAATSDEPDPNIANNTVTLRFEVVLPTSGGGSGGSGGNGSGVVATAGAVKLTPAKPRAGSLVSATVRVSASGAPVRPTSIACTGTIGSAKLKGSPKAASGSATCVYRTPKAAKGKTLRGAVSFAARGTKFAKRFSAKLG